MLPFFYVIKWFIRELDRTFFQFLHSFFLYEEKHRTNIV